MAALVELIKSGRHQDNEDEGKEVNEGIINGGPKRLEGGIAEQPGHGVGDDELAGDEGDRGPEQKKNHVPDGLRVELSAAGLGTAGGGVPSGEAASRLGFGGWGRNFRFSH